MDSLAFFHKDPHILPNLLLLRDMDIFFCTKLGKCFEPTLSR